MLSLNTKQQQHYKEVEGVVVILCSSCHLVISVLLHIYLSRYGTPSAHSRRKQDKDSGRKNVLMSVAVANCSNVSVQTPITIFHPHISVKHSYI